MSASRSSTSMATMASSSTTRIRLATSPGLSRRIVVELGPQARAQGVDDADGLERQPALAVEVAGQEIDHLRAEAHPRRRRDRRAAALAPHEGQGVAPARPV